MRDFLWNNFFLFIFLITQTSLFAFDSFPWSKSKGVSSVAPFIYVLEDKESLINNEDIFNNKLNKEFKKNNKDTV
ncbi:MAG: hypothetical protein KDK36_11750, partial [Leptospiraceae bacterium]|nr:hypothetical protein [Leptospiraceae bacterium]